VPAPAPDPRTVERLIADRRAEQEARRANESRRPGGEEPTQSAIVDRPPRVPTVDLEKTLRSVDNAVKAIDQRTKAVTDSATAIRLQAPTFKKVRMADQPSGPVVP
jgi:hypothetical protein